MYYNKALAYDHVPIQLNESFSCIQFGMKKRTHSINFRRLYRKAGVRRVCRNINTLSLNILKDYLKKALVSVINVAATENKKTITLRHLMYFLK